MVKNVFWCICTCFQTTRIFFFEKDIFERLECLKTCLLAFPHISRPPEIFLKKWFLWPWGVVKNVFWCICAYFQTTKNFFFKKDNFYCLEWLKRVLMHLRILQDHQKLFFKKDIFYCLEWLKTFLMHLHMLPDHQ